MLFRSIMAVHALPEKALENTLQRFNEYDRGAGISVMAEIQGGLPDGLPIAHILVEIFGWERESSLRFTLLFWQKTMSRFKLVMRLV